MEAIINLLLVMTVLSIGAERLTNIIKLRNKDIREKGRSAAKEKEREFAISGRSMVCGIILAVAVKADFFALLNSLEDPYKTLGWVRVENYKWMQSAATVSFAGFVYSLLGCVVTGVGLGFGSKFWHDILGIVQEVKDTRRKMKDQIGKGAPAGGGS